MRKLTLKVFMTCGKCKDKLVKQISEVSGVSKVELVDGCCSLLIVTGNFKLDEVLDASGKKRKCVAVESMEELPDPPPPPPPEPEQPTAPPEPPKPEEEPKPAEEPPKPADDPPPPPQIITVEKWPKELAKFGKLPCGVIVLVKNLFLCPHNDDKCDCDSCC